MGGRRKTSSSNQRVYQKDFVAQPWLERPCNCTCVWLERFLILCVFSDPDSPWRQVLWCVGCSVEQHTYPCGACQCARAGKWRRTIILSKARGWHQWTPSTSTLCPWDPAFQTIRPFIILVRSRETFIETCEIRAFYIYTYSIPR